MQIVMTATGELPIEEGLLFNVPEVPVVILATDSAAATLHGRLRAHPWITVVTAGNPLDVGRGVESLRTELGIRRISAVGGRTAATALIDAGVVTDLYLTTSPIDAGVPHTPLYTGTNAPPRRLIVRKQSSSGVVFEHFDIRRV
jgi:riboflavin biosynthesis pyrimidine reductase